MDIGYIKDQVKFAHAKIVKHFLARGHMQLSDPVIKSRALLVMHVLVIVFLLINAYMITAYRIETANLEGQMSRTQAVCSLLNVPNFPSLPEPIKKSNKPVVGTWI